VWVSGGASADVVPVAGDWNGGGSDVVGGHTPPTDTWWLRATLTSGPEDLVFRFPSPTSAAARDVVAP
jgi:hypothetical protein